MFNHYNKTALYKFPTSQRKQSVKASFPFIHAGGRALVILHDINKLTSNMTEFYAWIMRHYSVKLWACDKYFSFHFIDLLFVNIKLNSFAIVWKCSAHINRFVMFAIPMEFNVFTVLRIHIQLTKTEMILIKQYLVTWGNILQAIY